MKYLDSNVFVYAATLGPSDSKMAASKKLLLDVADGVLTAATSSLTWDEVVWAVKSSSGANAAKEEGSKLLELANMKYLNVDESVVLVAQELIEKHGLDPRDAIHAACCIENGITEMISDDSDFDGIKEITRIPLQKAAK